MKKVVVILVIVLALVGVFSYLKYTFFSETDFYDDTGMFTKTPTAEVTNTVATEPTVFKNVNITANFEIYTNGTKRIFTNSMYHNLSNDVYLEGSDPSVVHVKKAGVTWSDLFETLPMSLTKDCLITGTGQEFCEGESGNLSFYLNGQISPDALDALISQEDTLIIRYD